jgi:MoxR-like ATPase
VLLPALDERLLVIPRIGTVNAAEGFQVIATQNPVEYIATGHLSEALRDRFEHVALEYQSAPDEVAIVQRQTSSDNELLLWRSVATARATRVHPKFKKGASVRAAIAMVAVAEQLIDGGLGVDMALRRAAVSSLTTRTELRDELGADFKTALAEVLQSVEDLGLDQLRAVAERSDQAGAETRA